MRWARASAPQVSVYVKERHIGRESIDPPAETEIVYLMQHTGFSVVDDKNKPLADWAAAYLDDSSLKPLTGSDKVDVAIVGEAFSEFRCAARRSGELQKRAPSFGRSIRKPATCWPSTAKPPQPWIWPNIPRAKAALQKAVDELSLSLLPDLCQKVEREIRRGG